MERFQREWSLGSDGGTLLFSGGGDSTALFFLLLESCVEFRCLHFRHGDSAFQVESERFCRELCQRKRVAFESLPLQIEKPGALSWEAAARDLRYREVEKRKGPFLTAHTADDQAETLVMRLLDGSGLAGLAGIRSWRGRVYRPLLNFRRRELEQYLGTLGQKWLSDPTNQDGNDRGRLRHDIMPLLERSRPGLVESLGRTARELAEDEDALRREAERYLSLHTQDGDHWSLESLRELSPSIRYRVFRRLWKLAAGAQARPLGGLFRECERLVVQGGDDRGVGLGSARLRKIGRSLWLEPLDLGAVPELGLGRELAAPLELGGWLVCPPGMEPSPCGVGVLTMGLPRDAFQLGHDYRLRSRRPGDRFQGKDLKKLLATFPYPPWVRDRWPLLVKAEEVVRVLGIGTPDCQPGDGTLYFRPANYRWNPKG